MNFDFTFFISVFSELIPQLSLTLFLTVFSMIISIVVALIFSLLSIKKVPVLRHILDIVISFFRAVPTLVQLFIFYYGLPQLIPIFRSMTPITAVIVGLGLKQASFLSEIFRAAIISVDEGQLEAAATIGLTKRQTFTSIIAPQAFRNALPGMGNTIITTFKETSLAFTLGVVELLAEGQIIAASSFKYMETYLALAIIYWVIVMIYTSLQNKLEERINRPYVR